MTPILLILIASSWVDINDIQALEPRENGGCAIFVETKSFGINTDKDCDSVVLEIHKIVERDKDDKQR